MEINNKKINLSFMNDARILLLGVATLLVTFFHTYELNYLRLINQPIIANIIHFF